MDRTRRSHCRSFIPLTTEWDQNRFQVVNSSLRVFVTRCTAAVTVLYRTRALAAVGHRKHTVGVAAGFDVECRGGFVSNRSSGAPYACHNTDPDRSMAAYCRCASLWAGVFAGSGARLRPRRSTCWRVDHTTLSKLQHIRHCHRRPANEECQRSVRTIRGRAPDEREPARRRVWRGL